MIGKILQINDIKIIIASLQTNSKLWHAYCWIIKNLYLGYVSLISSLP